MKRLFLYFIFAIILICCEKNDKQDEATEYMNKIKSETYSDLFLPNLEPQDIAILLNYRDEKAILNKYPTNLISSFLCDSVTIGIIALWTIESIRISEQNGDTSEFSRFPSLNPMILDTTNIFANKFILQDSASTRYYKWWHQINFSQNERLQINPLQGSNIVWR